MNTIVFDMMENRNSIVSYNTELVYDRARCVGIDVCGACIEHCTNGVISIGKNDRIVLDQELTTQNLHLAEICPVQALYVRMK